MIVWMASYPRSGNFLLHKAIEAMYGIEPWTVYQADRRYDYRRRGDTPGETIFLKTHETTNHCHANDWPAIVLVRDGRGAIAREAAMWKADRGDPRPVEEIMRQRAYRGGWNSFYAHWTRRWGRFVVLRFEDMIADLASAVDTAVRALRLDLEVHHPCVLPVVRPAEEVLQGAIDQMPEDVEEVFWDCNGEMMQKLGYARGPQWSRRDGAA